LVNIFASDEEDEDVVQDGYRREGDYAGSEVFYPPILCYQRKGMKA